MARMQITTAQDPRAAPGVLGFNFDHGHGRKLFDAVVLEWTIEGIRKATTHADGVVTAVDGPYRCYVLTCQGYFTVKNHMLRGNPSTGWAAWDVDRWRAIDEHKESAGGLLVLDSSTLFWRPGKVSL